MTERIGMRAEWRAWSVRATLGLAALALIVSVTVVGHPGAQPAPSAPIAAPAVPVVVVRATKRDVPVTLVGLGQVQAFNAVMVHARVDGTLTSVPVTEGQEVKPGDLVAVIDPRPYQAALDQAKAKRQQDEAQLTNAKMDLARYEKLAKDNFATRQQMDTQNATIAQLKAAIAGDTAAIETAELNLSFCYVTAPIPGRVGLRQLDPGNLVHANDVKGIISIAQDRPISVVFTLPAREFTPILSEMGKGKLLVTAYSGDEDKELGTGELLAPDNAMDTSTGTIKLKAVFPNANDALWPGQFVEARLLLRTEHNILTVPSEAIQHGPSGLFAYVVKPDSTVAMQPVEAIVRGDVAVVSKGLSLGDQVVVRGQSRLQDGARVALVQS